MSRRSQTLGRIRLGLLYLFVTALILFARPTPASLVAGGLIALAGEALRIWAAGHLEKSVRLVTSGPYAHAQNPLYLGRLLILIGLAIASPNDLHLNLVALAGGLAVFFLYYLPRKLRVEGERLTRRHGPAFDAYRRAVPILLPALRAFPGERTPWSFARMLRNQEPLVLGGVLLAFAFLAWRTRGS